jgi:hypothetical protein
MVNRAVAILVCGLYMLPVIGLLAIPLPIGLKWSVVMILLPLALLALACIVMTHVIIFDAVRHIGRRREPNA